MRELRDRSKLKKPKFFGNPTANFVDVILQNYEEAMNSEDSKNWNNAMENEMNSLSKNETWILVNKPKDAKVLSNK